MHSPPFWVGATSLVSTGLLEDSDVTCTDSLSHDAVSTKEPFYGLVKGLVLAACIPRVGLIPFFGPGLESEVSPSVHPIPCQRVWYLQCYSGV